MTDVKPDTTPAVATERENTLAPPTEETARGQSLWTNAWQELKHNPLFWISSALILLFVVMAIAPGLFTQPRPTSGWPGRGRAPMPGSAGTSRATTCTPGPSTAPGPRSSSG